MELPDGHVNFLMTDVEGSTSRWERDADSMAIEMERHDALLRRVVGEHGGHLLKHRGEGDSSFSVFASVKDALLAALAIQTLLAESTSLKIRIGLHCGNIELRDGDYFGGPVSVCARLRDLGHGGQILTSQAVANRVEGMSIQGLSLSPLGRYLLKGISAAEDVYQLEHPSLASSFPPLRGIELRRENLHRHLTRFVGREAELESLATMLRQHRLLSIVGPGGCGKSRLASELAAAQVSRFDDGVWFIELATLDDPDHVTRELLAGIPFDTPTHENDAEALRASLEGKSSLLILDNCEHVLDGVAAAAMGALSASLSVTVLCTSREPIGVAGEQVLRLRPLAVELGDGSSAAGVGLAPAVELFMDRAALRVEGFSAQATPVALVTELCRQLDGLPLAIELAAAHVAALPLEELLAALKRGLGLLRSRRRAQHQAHDSMNHCIAWSFEQLSEQDQSLLSKLSVFRSGWDLALAARVCGAQGDDGGSSRDDLLAQMSELVDRSLVERDLRIGAVNRYTMLETIRHFARSELAARGDEERILAQHATQVLERALERTERFGSSEDGQVLEALRIEYADVRAALIWSADHAEGSLAIATASELWRFWHSQGRAREGETILESLLGKLREFDDPALEARARLALGILAYVRGAYSAAKRRYERSLELAITAGDEKTQMRALNNLGGLATDMANNDEARQHFRAGLEICRRIGSPVQSATFEMNLAGLSFAQGSLEDARAHLQSSLAIARTEGSTQLKAQAAIRLAQVQASIGDSDAAEALYRECLDLFKSLGDDAGAAESQRGLAEVLLARGELEEAGTLLKDALEMARQADSPIDEANVLTVLAELALHRSDWDRARTRLVTSLSIRQRTGNRQALQSTIAALIQVEDSVGEAERVLTLWGMLEAARQEQDVSPVKDSGAILSAVERASASLGEAEADRIRSAVDGLSTEAILNRLSRQWPPT